MLFYATGTQCCLCLDHSSTMTILQRHAAHVDGAYWRLPVVVVPSWRNIETCRMYERRFSDWPSSGMREIACSQFCVRQRPLALKPTSVCRRARRGTCSILAIFSISLCEGTCKTAIPHHLTCTQGCLFVGPPHNNTNPSGSPRPLRRHDEADVHILRVFASRAGRGHLRAPRTETRQGRP